MSNRKLVEWIERLVFGRRTCDRDDAFDSVPTELLPIVLRLQERGISATHLMRNGGLVHGLDLLHGDLDRCLEHFEGRSDEEPKFQTGALARFYNHLSVILARRTEEEKNRLYSVEPGPGDSAILDSILAGDDAGRQYRYSSPRYWGELARRLLNGNRSVKGLVPMSAVPEKYLRNAVRLYDVTVKTLGQLADPLTMYLLPNRNLQVDPVHFDSAEALEAFARVRPDHALTRSVRLILRRLVDGLLNGRSLELLGPHERLDAFLKNAIVVHEEIHRVVGKDEPPLLVDVFHRLLAMTRYDYLWQETPDVRPSDEGDGDDRPSSLFGLTSRIALLEKQNAFLLEHLRKG